MAMVTEDRKRDGLALDASMLDNGGLASMAASRAAACIDRRRQASDWSATKLDELSIRPRDTARPVRQL